MKTLIISIFLIGSFNCLTAEPQEQVASPKNHRIELVEPEFVQRKLATLDKGRHSVKNTKRIINLIRYHTSDPVTSEHLILERDAPAVGYLLSSYDADIVPLLFEYALTVNDLILQRRAVYCVEQLSGQAIDEYMTERLGVDLQSGKFKELLAASRVAPNKRLKMLESLDNSSPEQYKEIAKITVENYAFYFPRMSLDIWYMDFLKDFTGKTAK